MILSGIVSFRFTGEHGRSAMNRCRLAWFCGIDGRFSGVFPVEVWDPVVVVGCWVHRNCSGLGVQVGWCAHDGGDHLLVSRGYFRDGGAAMMLVCFLAGIGDLNMSNATGYLLSGVYFRIFLLVFFSLVCRFCCK